MPNPPGLPISDSQSSALLFGRYHNNQGVIAQHVTDSIKAMWTQIVDPYHFSDSWRRLEPIVEGIVDTHYSMSSADASQYYGLSRASIGLLGGNVPSGNIDQGYLSHVVNVMGNGQFYHFLKNEEAPNASVMARDALSGSAVRLVMNGGRNTVIQAAHHDPVAMGWERIIEPKSCDYCSRLAASSGIHKATSEVFHAHDDCQCLARVVFAGQSSANAELAVQWQKATAGKSGNAANAAWSQYWSENSGSNGNGGGEPEAQTAPTGEGAGNAPVEVQQV
jgi:hypothetical protein